MATPRPRIARRHARRQRPRRLDPLTAWRQLGPQQLTTDLMQVVRAALCGSLVLHDRRWPAAPHDPVAAIAIAAELIPEGGPKGPAGDLAMSALLVHAQAGDRTARLVLAHSLVQAAQAGGNSPTLFAHALGWARLAGDMGPLAGA